MSWVVGPSFKQIARIGLSGPRVVLSTGTYSRKPLIRIAEICTATSVDFMGRLNLRDPTDWVQGSVDPRALVDFADRLGQKGIRTRILVAPDAHAKVYVGSRGVLMGSANLSLRGFGAGPEILCFFDSSCVARAFRVLDAYSGLLREIDLESLRDYVQENEAAVLQDRGSRRAIENQLPPTRIQMRGNKVGSYPDFISWCRQSSNPAAQEIARRAAGKGNLQGHIHRNFYGIRQYLLANPGDERRLARNDPTQYRVFADHNMDQRVNDFVRDNAVNEIDFPLRIWETYLPVELGGRAGRRGGSIGNLNRMFPLVAAYLRSL